jgi:5-methylcytosine-specific restriction endonuclease McrA
MRAQGRKREWCADSCRAVAVRVGLGQDRSGYAPALRRDPCSYCGEPSKTIDHIVPRRDGGEHGWENLAAACALCNSQKGPMSLLRFMLARPLLAELEAIRDRLRPLTADWIRGDAAVS